MAAKPKKKQAPQAKRAKAAKSPAPLDSSPPPRRIPPNWEPIEAAYLRFNKPPRALAEMPEARAAGIGPIQIMRHMQRRGLTRERKRNGAKIRERWLAEAESRAQQFERAHAGKFALVVEKLTAAALDALNPSQELEPQLQVEMYKAAPAMVQAAARAAAALMDIRGIPKPKQSIAVDHSGKVTHDLADIACTMDPAARAELLAAVERATRPK